MHLSRFGRALLLLVVFCLVWTSVVFADDKRKLVIGVEDRDWAGHYRWSYGELTGMDADLVRIVGAKLGYEIEFKPYPWARVLMMAEDGTVDGVLDLAPTKERKRFLYYVKTPISAESTVFWVKMGSSFKYTGSFDSSMRIGLMHGSDWSDRFAREGTPTVVRFESFKSAFSSLDAGRIDAFGGHLAPTREEVLRLGFVNRIEPSTPIISNLPYYMAFSHKPGHKALAEEFSKVLRALYESDEYADFLADHGVVNRDRGFYPPPFVDP